MKFKVKISKFLKLYKDQVNEEGSMYFLIDEYLRTHHYFDVSLPTNTLDYAFFKLVKKIDRSKLAVDIFVAEPKFTKQCPTNLVKPEYQEFFLDSSGNFVSKKFLQLLEFVGVKEFTIKCDEDGDIHIDYCAGGVKYEVRD